MEINLPNNWSGVKLYQYQELNSINVEDFDSDMDILIEKICILSELDNTDEIFDNLDFDELIEILNRISWINNEPPLNFTKSIDKYKIKDINRITLGEFIDLEFYFSDNWIKNLHYICSILYKITRQDDFGNEYEEPYIYDLNKRSNIYLDVPISMIWGVVKYYLDFKDLIEDKYHTVWDSDGLELEDKEGLSPEEIVEIEREIEEDKKKSRWSWQWTIHNLAGGDITKYDDITNMRLSMVLNELSMRKALNI